MELANADRFNRITTAIFNKLYETFPAPVRLDAYVLGLSLVDPSGYVNGEPVDAVNHPDHVFFIDCARVLKNFGYIAAELNGVSACSALLTEKALLLENALPSVLKSKA